MAQVAVVMGSTSDWPAMQKTTVLLDELGVTYEKHIISAHRMPQHLQVFGQQAQKLLLLVLVVQHIYLVC